MALDQRIADQLGAAISAIESKHAKAWNADEDMRIRTRAACDVALDVCLGANTRQASLKASADAATQRLSMMNEPDTAYVDDPTLGAEMCHQGIALKGELSLDRWREFLIAVARSMDMHPTGNTMTWKYPAGGKGGVGATVVQPITESFLALDTYDNHRGAYLFVASCRPFSRSQIEPVAASFGLEYVDESQFAVLRLAR